MNKLISPENASTSLIEHLRDVGFSSERWSSYNLPNQCNALVKQLSTRYVSVVSDSNNTVVLGNHHKWTGLGELECLISPVARFDSRIPSIWQEMWGWSGIGEKQSQLHIG